MNNHIGIFGGFKNATSTLQHSFNCKKYHDLPFLIPNEEFDKLDIIIIPYRKNEHVYPSAFFQDIIIKEYAYSPFHENNFLEKFSNLSKNEKKDIILRSNIEDIYKLYKKIKWNKLINLNNKLRLQQINDYYKINLKYHEKETQILKININNKVRTLICFNCWFLNDRFEELKKIIFNEQKNNIKLIESNIGKTKWYQDKYKLFIEYLKKKGEY